MQRIIKGKYSALYPEKMEKKPGYSPDTGDTRISPSILSEHKEENGWKDGQSPDSIL